MFLPFMKLSSTVGTQAGEFYVQVRLLRYRWSEFCSEYNCIIKVAVLRKVTTQMTSGYFLFPVFPGKSNLPGKSSEDMFLKLSAFFTSETVVCFLSHSSPPNKDCIIQMGKRRKACTSLLLAILLYTINYKACSLDPVWILKLSQKQFSPRGYQEEVKGLPIKQTDITGKGQKTGKYCDISPL